MTRNLTLILLLAAVFPLTTACESAPKKAAVKPVMIINLTSGPDDLHAAWMGLALADHGLADDQEVIVFMNVAAPPLASSTLDPTLRLGEEAPMREVVAGLIAKGAKVLVCPACARKLDVAEADLVQGAAFASRESLFGSMNERTVVFSY